MTTPVGGRGKVAPYKTIHVRIPEPIKEEVQELTRRYRDSVFGDSDVADASTPSMTSEEAVEKARQILKLKKSAKLSMQKLLTSIYNKEVSI